MIPIDFVNRLKPRPLGFLKFITKGLYLYSAFNIKLENINSNFRLVSALSTNVSEITSQPTIT